MFHVEHPGAIECQAGASAARFLRASSGAFPTACRGHCTQRRTRFFHVSRGRPLRPETFTFYARKSRKTDLSLAREYREGSASSNGRPMFKFIHAADLHLASPLRRLEHYPGAPVDRIRNATYQALENLVTLALKEEVDFVL